MTCFETRAKRPREANMSAASNTAEVIFDDDLQYSGTLPPAKIISECSENKISFNVMPGKHVKETLHIKEYRVWEHRVEGIFDREYFSSMTRSPDHLIFLTALVHLQKLLYVFLCHKFGFKYDPFGDEKLKIWPTRIDTGIPSMIRKKTNLVQSFEATDLHRRPDGSFFITGISRVGELVIDGDALVFLLETPDQLGAAGAPTAAPARTKQ